MRRRLLALLLSVGLLLPATSARAVGSYPNTVNWDYYMLGCVVDAGNVCEATIDWIDANGGIEVFGLPIGHATYNERTQALELPFERFRLEFRDEAESPYNFQLGLSGEERLIQKGYIWQNAPKETAQAGCRFFPETGYNLCNDFLKYWRTHGREFDRRKGKTESESLALFGYPITAARMEPGEDGVPRLTQWFQRARLEYHDGIGVLMGRLNIETVQGAGGDTLIPLQAYDLPDVSTPTGQYLAGGVYGGPKDIRGIIWPSNLTIPGGAGSGGGGGRLRCSDFDTWDEAQAALEAGHTELDRDGDGIACESLR
jgi:hypothetical protein